MKGHLLGLALSLAAAGAAFAQQAAPAAGRVVLGQVANGNTVAFVREGPAGWGIEIAGFYSAIRLHSDPDLTWPDVSILAPSRLYADSTNNGRGPGGIPYDRARRFSFREDYLPAPLFAGWCLTQQRPDGSFARSYMLGTEDVVQESGATSYNVAPLFPMLTTGLGDKRYLDSALRAAEYVWQDYGSRGIFVGGAIDNPNITDKEAGMLSLEAFLSLYKSTGDPHYREVARILLHNTKAMLALPGGRYGMYGPGWQQEHWSLAGNRRGYGQPEKWMPWVTTNHLYSVYGLEAYDPAHFRELAAKPK